MRAIDWILAGIAVIFAAAAVTSWHRAAGSRANLDLVIRVLIHELDTHRKENDHD